MGDGVSGVVNGQRHHNGYANNQEGGEKGA